MSPVIINFLKKFEKAEEIKAEEFCSFFTELKKLEKSDHDSICDQIISIAHNIYQNHKNDIEIAIKIIDEDLGFSRPIRQYESRKAKFINLINVYHLMIEEPVKKRFIHHNIHWWTLTRDIPFAINALSLTGLLPKEDLNGINTAIPLYPLEMEGTDKLAIKKGVKGSDAYFPYKAHMKVVTGTPENTFVATNGKKALYMRGVLEYSPYSIFSSKIATFISPTHFASERLMDNKIVGSRALSTYAKSIIEVETNTKNKAGAGIIHEVSNYVVEIDRNLENIGISSTNLENPELHLSKIDFDGCEPDFHVTKEDYGKYGPISNRNKDPRFYNEMLCTRLKLSMLTEPLLQGMADKSFIDKDSESKNRTVKACAERSQMTLELFFEYPNARKFTEDNPNILNKCYTEAILYIKEHFDNPAQKDILKSLDARVTFIHSVLTEKLSVKIVDLKVMEIDSLKIQDKKRKPAQKHIQNEITPIHNIKMLEKTFYKPQVDHPSKGRWHALTVEGKDLNDPELRLYKGDYLKSRILLEFIKKLSRTNSQKELEDVIKEIKSDPKFQILKKAQGLTTKFFNLETSSIKAFKMMVEAQEDIIKKIEASTFRPKK